MQPKRALIMHPHDNVATAVEDIQEGEIVAVTVTGRLMTLTTVETIPFGFKLALQEIPQGGIIKKYGETIGRAITVIIKGTMVHIHNLEGTRARGDLPEGYRL